jgi:hypothetical protein
MNISIVDLQSLYNCDTVSQGGGINGKTADRDIVGADANSLCADINLFEGR